jgi:hypothetical protein
VANPVYHVYVDWDCTEWAGVHDFSQAIDDITNDVKHLRISRGKDRDSNNYPAATLEMLLENSSGEYYPTATSGNLVGKVRLWLPVKVTALFGGTTYGLFYGYINRITAYPIKSKQDIYFYATDGVDLLTKQIIVQDMDDKTVMSDGEAVHQVLNAAGWRAASVACTMQDAGNTVTKASHGLSNGDTVMFTGALLPATLDIYTLYYVNNVLQNTFTVATTLNGIDVNFAANGSGYYYQIRRRLVDNDGGDITNFPDTFEFTKL